MTVLFFFLALGVILVIGPFITMFLWSWVMHDIAPGLVESGAIVSHLTWWVAFKVNIAIGILFGTAGGLGSIHSENQGETG